jgi:mono/diheme cytochrome c family protein
MASCALALAAAPMIGAEAPAKPTFTKDVLPILQDNCQTCHRPQPLNMSGMTAPFALTTYEEARPWAKAIAKAVESKKMPPWFATDEFHGVFSNERGLTGDEINTVVSWVQQGAARGNPQDAPEPRDFPQTDWWLGEPDLVVDLPEPVWVGDEVSDWQPNIDVKLTDEMLPEDRWIKTIEAQAGSEPVHHIVVFKLEPGGAMNNFGGQNIGGLAPGAEPSFVQEGYGIQIKKGSTLRINMHYHKEAGPGTGVYDNSRLGLFFYPKDEKVNPIQIEPIGSTDFEIPPNAPDYTVSMAKTFNQPFRVLNYLPHMHVRGKSALYTAYLPDGTSEKLLDVPSFDYNWQLYYEYPEPRLFPAGTRIEAEFTYDNSTNNPSNPDPNDAVAFGLDTTKDEMAFGWMYYSLENARVTGGD